MMSVNPLWLSLLLLALSADGSKCFQQQKRRSFVHTPRGGATRQFLNPQITLSVTADPKSKYNNDKGSSFLEDPAEVCKN